MTKNAAKNCEQKNLHLNEIYEYDIIFTVFDSNCKQK